jgi:5'-hydroxyaverantin dehydrogenase
VQFIQTDVTSFPAQLLAFKAAIAFSPHHSIDVVIPCSGLAGGSLLDHETSPPTLSQDPTPPSTKVLDLNLKAVLHTTYLALYYFRVPSSPAHTSLKSLVLISSIGGYQGLLWTSAYNAAKFGARGLWKSLRAPLPALGIRANLIAPWVIHTPMTDPFLDLLKEAGMTFVKVVDVVDAAVRCEVDETIQNRAILTMPQGNIDLRDDADGLDRGVELQRAMEGMKTFSEAAESIL